MNEDFRSAADRVRKGVPGQRRRDHDEPMTTDSVLALFSTTKAITATAALQLAKEGRLDLATPAETHAPDIGTLQAVEGMNLGRFLGPDSGRSILRQRAADEVA